MNKDVLYDLVNYLNPQTRQYKGGRPEVKPDKMVAMTLYFLGNKSAYKQLATQFGVSEYTFIRCTDYIIGLLINKVSDMIRFPEKDELPGIVGSFDDIGKYFPNVVGALDSCHLPVRVKKRERGSFYNYKNFHSIQLQAVCLPNRLFTDCFVGFPGHAHSAAVYRDSPLAEDIKTLLDEPGKQVEEKYSIVADSAYQQTEFVMSAFKIYGRNNTPMHKKFNTHLASKRNVVERSFQLLFSRWPRLQKLTCRSQSRNANCILAACTLHNWCILKDDLDDEVFDPQNVVMGNQFPLTRAGANVGGIDQLGVIKRDRIMRQISRH